MRNLRVGTYVEHETLGPGRVTSIPSAGYAFVKFSTFSSSRMCVNGSLTIHEPVNDDGVRYCGWTGDAGTIDGCGHAWPCPTARIAGAA